MELFDDLSQKLRNFLCKTYFSLLAKKAETTLLWRKFANFHQNLGS